MKEWLVSLPPIPVTTLLLIIFVPVLSLLLLAYLGYLARSPILWAGRQNETVAKRIIFDVSYAAETAVRSLHRQFAGY